MYDFPDKAKIIKIKVQYNINRPAYTLVILKLGVNWLDFRYENLPLFCFNYGLIGHGEDLCEVEGFKEKNTTGEMINPRGASLRSKVYGRRVMDKKDLRFSSNPMKSLSGGQFSPIPKELLDMMDKMNIQDDHKDTTSQQQQDPIMQDGSSNHKEKKKKMKVLHGRLVSKERSLTQILD